MIDTKFKLDFRLLGFACILTRGVFGDLLFSFNFSCPLLFILFIVVAIAPLPSHAHFNLDTVESLTYPLHHQ